MHTLNDEMRDAIRLVKSEFMVYRNGVVADILRQSGMPYKVIFGLQLPQISEIASRLKSKLPSLQISELARELWNDTNVRESRLLACKLMSSEKMESKTVLRMCREVQTQEEADFIVFTLLKDNPMIGTVRETLSAEEGQKSTLYVIKAIDRFLQ
ncbi:MAG: DNA alkylation repair protein [Muribaculaceae bacterium]|nr:DNA alkylation repair protein [Muribaculaceae bacterium]